MPISLRSPRSRCGRGGIKRGARGGESRREKVGEMTGDLTTDVEHARPDEGLGTHDVIERHLGQVLGHNGELRRLMPGSERG